MENPLPKSCVIINFADYTNGSQVMLPLEEIHLLGALLEAVTPVSYKLSDEKYRITGKAFCPTVEIVDVANVLPEEPPPPEGSE